LIYSKGFLFPLTICLTSYLFFTPLYGGAQTPVIMMPSEIGRNPTLQQVFFEKESTVGSSLLSRYWMKGTVLLENHKLLPVNGQPLYFNYDKLKSVVYAADLSDNLWTFPIDSVQEFTMRDSSHEYEFRKVPQIDTRFFLMPVIESEKGYSLYKRLFTKLEAADFSNGGYFTKGNKYDQFVDYYEYYLLLPGKTEYRKFSMKEAAVNRSFKVEKQLVAQYNSINEMDMTEEYLLGLVQYINDKKYPDP